MSSSTGVQITFANLNDLSNTVYLAMYGNNQLGGPTCSFSLDSEGNVTLSPLTAGGTVPVIQFSAIPLVNNVPTINLGTQWIDSARIYFSVGTALSIPVSADGNSVTNPSPLVSGYGDIAYDWIEFTLNQAGALYINTTQVDMFGLPIQLTINPLDATGVPRVGILDSRDSVFTALQTFLGSIPSDAKSAFGNLLLNDSSGNPIRMLNPTDAIALGLAAPALGSYFDAYIQAFFAKYSASGATLALPSVTGAAGTGANGGGVHSLQGSVSTLSSTNVLGQNASYTVLSLTDTTTNTDGSKVSPANGQVYTVFAPFFSTNSVSPTYNPAAPVATAASATGPAGLNYFTVDAATLALVTPGMVAAGAGIALNSIVTGIDSASNIVTINTNVSAPINGAVSFFTSNLPAPPALAPVTVSAIGTQGNSTLTLSSVSGIDPSAGLVIVNGPGIAINNVVTAVDATNLTVTLAAPNVNDVNGNVVFAAQSLLANALTLLPSTMVVAGNGVLADNVYQFPTDSNRSILLGAIENLIASAFNRGIANNDCSDWSYTFADQQSGAPNPFYDTGNPQNSSNTWNYYGQFLHQQAISANSLSYAISFDDQGGFSTTLSESASANVVTVNATLMPLQTTLSFNDGPTVSALGSPLISGMTVRSGDILNAIQTTISATGGTTAMPQHGDSSGTPSSFVLAAEDALVSVSGSTGIWHGWNCVTQLTLTTRNGTVYGPFGTMAGVTSSTTFNHTAPDNQSVIAFSGALVNVPLADGTTANVIQSLQAVFG